MTTAIILYLLFGALLVCVPALSGRRSFPSAGAVVISAIAWPGFIVWTIYKELREKWSVK